MKSLSATILIAATLAFTGCASLPQKPRTFDQLGQFASYPLNAQSFRISFKAAPNMSYGVAEEITLLKAAQTTVQNGFRYFKVLNDPSNLSQKPPRQAVVYSSPNFYYPYGYHRRNPAFWPDPFYDTPQVVNIDPVEVSYTISCFKNQQTAPSDAFDATLILRSLGHKYGLGPNGEVLIPQPPAHKAANSKNTS
ncbi:CC0125/CC1285 family lipoprotein [Acinetobacter baylyi]|nr:hypothetical protein [Acinetobacter baylyi]ENV55269.1 hypothetical protein F952_00548 [Acinetobacter baylyi DSM 14961 = CIP 107474]KAF2370984.1 hypothetical protein BSL88_07020 [Acinetobacter baylyi]KAF2374806.1 hypothetical protein BSL67_05765 [Acinetobacter baylyi]KAF2378997.1 hypothetical protein BSN81_00420 [Acinetobacter baylyi]KAF2381940.1 hypothetical protein BSN83_05605 [Acinetobacter baylyi]